MIKTTLLLLIFVFAISKLEAAKQKKTKLVNNGYEDVLIAIYSAVPEEERLIVKIKEMMTEASRSLLEATKGRAFFRNIKILVPSTWTEGQYPPSREETYKQADIRIAPSRADLADTPYAMPAGDGACGDEMQYIHLTPNFVKSDGIPNDFGPIGKTIVHEWGHYRWGVFDEYPVGRTPDERHANSFYLDSKGKVQATRCSKHIKGDYLYRNRQNCLNSVNPKTRLPKLGCHFYDDKNQLQGLEASMMYKQFINGVTTFCHDDKNDEKNVHNYDAPSKHNRKCNHRSTWDVISKSTDFNFDNPPNEAITPDDTTPQFSIIQSKSKSIVLVMDTSGSMDGAKLDSLRKSAEHFLSRCVANGINVGLVSFATYGSILHNLVEVNSEFTREQLINRLPSYASGGTGIGSGILRGIEVLEQGGRSPEGGTLIVLTDGEENEDPSVQDVSSSVLQKGVLVYGIFYGLANEEVQSLADLSAKSGGNWFYNQDDVGLNAELNNIFCSLAIPESGDPAFSAVAIASETFLVPENSTVSNNVSIDGSTGNWTTFSFAWGNEEPHITLTPPNSSCYYSNREDNESVTCENIHVTNIRFKTLEFRVPGKAETGLWRYEVSDSDTDYVTIAVTSISSVEGQSPVTLEPDAILKNDSGLESVIIVAQVSQDIQPIVGATVTATIARPVDGPVEISLMDNGAGADHTANDGIYSRYFSNFTAQGRYSFEVRVYKNGSEETSTTDKTGYSTASKDPFDSFSYVEAIPPAKIIGVLERIAPGPGFSYTGNVTTSDIFPPNKIIDLSVSQIDLDDARAGVMISFTAPGDDFDSGTAAYYDIRYTNDSLFLLLSSFEEQMQVNLTDGASTIPKEVMSPENIAVTLPVLPDSPFVRLAFAMRSYDEAGNPSEVSNLVLKTFFIEPPPKPQPSRLQFLLGYLALLSSAVRSILIGS